MPIQFTWDRPSAYRDGTAYSVAVRYASASPATTLSANPIRSTTITFDHAEAYDGAHYFNVYSLEDAVAVLTAFRMALVDDGYMLHCHDTDAGLTMRSNAGFSVDTTGCERTRLTDEGVPSHGTGDHVIIEDGGQSPGYDNWGWRGNGDETYAPRRWFDGALEVTFLANSNYQAVSLEHEDKPLDLSSFASGRMVVEMKVEQEDDESDVQGHGLSIGIRRCPTLAFSSGCFATVGLTPDVWGDSWRTVSVDIANLDPYPSTVVAGLLIERSSVGANDIVIRIRDARWVLGPGNLPPSALPSARLPRASEGANNDTTGGAEGREREMRR